MFGSTMLCTPGSKGLLVLVAVVAVTLSPTRAGGQTPQETYLYVDEDGDGGFSLSGVYPFAVSDLLSGYLQTDVRWSGDAVLATVHPGGTFEVVGPGEEFAGFVQTFFPQAASLRGCPPCDTNAQVSVQFACTGACPTPCPTAGPFTITGVCFNTPPCPSGKICFGHAERVTTFTLNQAPCRCNAQNNCEANPGTVVTAFTTNGPICECADLVPALPPLAVCLLYLLVLGISAAVIQRGRRADGGASVAG